jgi:hypothetical protein
VSRATRFIPVLALVAGLTLGAWILFGPTYSYCSMSLSSDGTRSTVCGTSNLVAAQAGQLFPALIFITAWSLAPVFAVIGTRSGSRGYALALTGCAFVLDATSLVSFGGFLFGLLVGPLLLLTLALIVAGSRRRDVLVQPK